MYIACDWCGEQHYRRPSHVYDHNFCSKACFKAWIQKDKPRILCEWCGKEFLVSPVREESAKFCSPECYQKWRTTERIGMRGDPPVGVECSWCGAKLQRKPARIKRSEHHFCDTVCMGKWRAENVVGEAHPLFLGGREPYYGANWKRQRRIRRKKDNHTCQGCGMTEDELGRAMDVHHIMPFRKFGLEEYKQANRLDNLVSLCPACHTHEEMKLTERRAMNSSRQEATCRASS